MKAISIAAEHFVQKKEIQYTLRCGWYWTLIGPVQATGFAGGLDCYRTRQGFLLSKIQWVSMPFILPGMAMVGILFVVFLLFLTADRLRSWYGGSHR